MSVGLLTIILLAILVLLLGFGVRIAFCLGFIGAVGILIFLEPGVLYQIAEVAADTGTNIFLITLPLFILMAEVVSFSGVGDDMYTAAHDWLSWLPGGLRHQQHRHLHGFCRHLRIESCHGSRRGRRVCSGNDQERLQQEAGRGLGLGRGDSRNPDPPQHHHDHLRAHHRDLHRKALHRRDHPGHHHVPDPLQLPSPSTSR